MKYESSTVFHEHTSPESSVHGEIDFGCSGMGMWGVHSAWSQEADRYTKGGGRGQHREEDYMGAAHSWRLRS
jgi:hypothetical protein